MPGSQNYYEEGIRFYLHGGKGNSYTTATTPGLLLPEEYYGSVYFPGVTRLVPPGAIGDYFRTAGESEPGRRAFDTWRHLLRSQVFDEPATATAKNPFRLAYFENGYRSARDTHYLVIASSAGPALQEALHRWTSRGLAAEYLEDTTCLARHALAHPQLIQVVPPSAGVDSLTRLTPMSSGYCLISEREPERKKINHGRAINWSARVHLAALFTLCVSVGIDMTTLGLALGLGSSTFIETMTPKLITALQGKQLQSIREVFETGTPLAKVLTPATNRTVDTQIAKWVDRGFPML
jgi:hypothetical protein